MHLYAGLAQEAVKNHFGYSSLQSMLAELPPKILAKKAGVFVTIYNHGELRGCIGTLKPAKENIAEEIVANAVSAATLNNRFLPITIAELPELNYEISVLSEAEEVSSLLDLDPQKYGVIIRSGQREGVLLPGIEEVKTVAEQIAIAAGKGKISLDKDEIKVYRFTTETYK